MVGTSVDDHIVAIKFDNALFARNIADTITALERLRISLGHANAQKGLESLAASASKVDLGPLSTSIEGINAKFLAMSTIAITALQRITNAAIDAGGKIVKALTITPVLDGFQEYETNINSIQTILANTDSKGTTLEQVNSALDELNHYADQTIYNFSEMTRNIGTFTAAGVDLETSVGAIKGIANIAAISGSNSQQASTAMYQLSQALASGTVKLMDWNSVVNAGMGGEVFQKALFDTGKALGTIADVPMDQTFEQWKDAGNSFRESLQDGWITADVLTTTLQGFTGDMNEAELVSLGYTRQQAKEMARLGQLGKAAATEVKTFTQLIGTVKEAMGSGWATSFRLVVGDFREAKVLFSGIGAAIGRIVGESTDARNQMLLDWKTFGGRNALLEGLVNTVKGLGSVLKPIMFAFRSIFPRKTAEDLLIWTDRFRDFSQKLQIGSKTAEKVAKVFGGVFSVFKIGIEIVKGVAGVIGDIFSAIAPAGSGALTGLSTIGDVIINLQKALVEGGGIADFFDGVGKAAAGAVTAVVNFVSKIADLFDRGEDSSSLSEGFADAEGSANRLSGIVEKLSEFWDAVVEKTKGVGETIGAALGGIGEAIGEGIQGGGIENVVKIINGLLVGGLIATITLFVRRLKKGFDDLNFMSHINGVIDEFGNTLKAMQLKLKAEALQKLAIAIAILAASMLLLSFIDSDKLAASMAAVAAGMATLIGAMAALTAITSGTGAAKLPLIAITIGLLAGSILVLALAVKVFSMMDPEELFRGLVGIAAGLAILTIAVRNLGDAGGKKMIATAFAIGAISFSLLILAGAVKLFSMMDMAEMAKGLVGMGVALAILVTTINSIDRGTKRMIATGIALAGIGFALLIVAGAVKLFSMIDTGDMIGGLAGMAGALAAIALATNKMPGNLPMIGLGLILTALALGKIADVIKTIGEIETEVLLKGLLGIAGALLIIGIATKALDGSLSGGLTLFLISVALRVLVDTMEILAGLSIAQIMTALGAMLGLFVVIGLAAAGAMYLIPGLIVLSATMLALGVAMVLFGTGVLQFARAWAIMVGLGEAGTQTLTAIMQTFITMLPSLIEAFGRGMLKLAETLIEGLPPIIEGLIGLLVASLGGMLDGIKTLIPKVGAVIRALLKEIIKIVKQHGPDMIEVGFLLLTNFLAGLDRNIEEIAERAVSIVTQFVDVIASNADRITESAVNMLLAFMLAISERQSDIVGGAIELLASFIGGIADNIHLIQEAAAKLIVEFLAGLAGQILVIVDAGAQLLMMLMFGIASKIAEVATYATKIVIALIDSFTANGMRIVQAGAQALVAFLGGISANLTTVTEAAADVVAEFVAAMANAALLFIEAGGNAIIDVVEGLGSKAAEVMAAGVKVILQFLKGIGKNALILADGAAKVLIQFLNGLATAINTNAEAIRKAGARVAFAIIDGMTGGLASKVKEVAEAAVRVAKEALDKVRGFLGINSPSKEFIIIGKSMAEGMVVALDNDKTVQKSAVALSEDIVNAFGGILKRASDGMGQLDDIRPVIAPVLDLSDVEKGAGRLSGLLSVNTITPEVSFNNAKAISVATSDKPDEPDDPSAPAPSSVTFNQTINAPRQLSTADIYRNTKGQIEMAKEELGVR